MCGYIFNIRLPHFIRPFLLNCYKQIYDIDLNEAFDTELSNYESLGEFFCRKLDMSKRPVDQDALLVSFEF